MSARWISTKDRLPESENIEVLFMSKFGTLEFGYYDSDEPDEIMIYHRTFGGMGQMLKDYTHWLEITELPND